MVTAKLQPAMKEVVQIIADLLNRDDVHEHLQLAAVDAIGNLSDHGE
jgi:hypothetical protein